MDPVKRRNWLVCDDTYSEEPKKGDLKCENWQIYKQEERLLNITQPFSNNTHFKVKMKGKKRDPSLLFTADNNSIVYFVMYSRVTRVQ